MDKADTTTKALGSAMDKADTTTKALGSVMDKADTTTKALGSVMDKADTAMNGSASRTLRGRNSKADAMSSNRASAVVAVRHDAHHDAGVTTLPLEPADIAHCAFAQRTFVAQ